MPYFSRGFNFRVQFCEEIFPLYVHHFEDLPFQHTWFCCASVASQPNTTLIILIIMLIIRPVGHMAERPYNVKLTNIASLQDNCSLTFIELLQFSFTIITLFVHNKQVQRTKL